MTPVLYAMRPLGPEITRRALLHRLRQHGIQVVSLPAGHYVLGVHRPTVERVVAELNANLRRLSGDRRHVADAQLQVLFRPVPAPSDGETE